MAPATLRVCLTKVPKASSCRGVNSFLQTVDAVLDTPRIALSILDDRFIGESEWNFSIDLRQLHICLVCKPNLVGGGQSVFLHIFPVEDHRRDHRSKASCHNCAAS